MGSGRNGEAAIACAVVGTGNMGAALASVLLAAGHRVTVWNRSPDRYASLLERGAEEAESVAAAVGGAELVVVCLLDHPTTCEVFAADGAADALAGRTLLQFSYSSGREAAAFQSWVEQHGGNYLHGQIKAYPREMGTPAARLNYSGSHATFESLRDTLVAFGEPLYLGSDVAAACVVSNASTVLYLSIVAAFFEAAAYATAEGGDLASFVSLLPTSVRLAIETIEYSVRQIAERAFSGDQASIDAHANALATALSIESASRCEPRLARAVRDYLTEAQTNGLGSLEIAVVYEKLVDSLGAPKAESEL